MKSDMIDSFLWRWIGRTQMLFTRFQDVAYGDVDIRDKWGGVEEDEDDDGIDQDGTRNPITVPVVAV